IELAFERHKAMGNKINLSQHLRLGVDVAGMGRDSSLFCHRWENIVTKFRAINSGGTANHMEITGIIANELKAHENNITSYKPKAFIDTIGEGAGVFSRLEELQQSKEAYRDILFYSCKYSESAKDYKGEKLHDKT